ncbi:hypothetical protein JAAARDRAFT_65576 [Jaapia argillacea MUCL 33604]|uniref:TECPR1-like DysF domain-containing protein n=1 Tax=Jaapia argillacea MUCL 33604 TaxID=933084 RepID=A0A067Q927_9AGAM|nr:hypothetical protein JAAARDRAFT_65576 [Jaapia argillacea MUCL 33604]
MSTTPSTDPIPPCPPPPPWMQTADPAEADQARLRLAPKSHFPLPSFLRLPRSRKSSNKGKRTSFLDYGQEPEDTDEVVERVRATESEEVLTIATLMDRDVRLDDSLLEEPEDRDIYRWAILYENQRGATIFSTPYYSRLSLLPTDPPPFTLPYSGPSSALPSSSSRIPLLHSRSSPKATQPKISSLAEYPLPDGTWHWVSSSWMIDMRADGEVGWDGFEYNWVFKRRGWVGIGGGVRWVRRRRWVRLMVRPRSGRCRGNGGEGDEEGGNKGGHGHKGEMSGPGSVGPTPPPSIIFPNDEGEHDEVGDVLEKVWQGDPEGDWKRCHAVLKRLPRDGRMLEMWGRWLGVGGAVCLGSTSINSSRSASLSPASAAKGGLALRDVKGKGVARDGEVEGYIKKQWTEDEHPLPSEVQYANRVLSKVGESVLAEYVAPVLCSHGSEILQLFTFPDSRAHFLSLLGRVGLLKDLEAGLGVGGGLEPGKEKRLRASGSAATLDFWSYRDEVGGPSEGGALSGEEGVERGRKGGEKGGELVHELGNDMYLEGEGKGELSGDDKKVLEEGREKTTETAHETGSNKPEKGQGRLKAAAELEGKGLGSAEGTKSSEKREGKQAEDVSIGERGDKTPVSSDSEGGKGGKGKGKANGFGKGRVWDAKAPKVVSKEEVLKEGKLMEAPVETGHYSVDDVD